MDRKEKNKLRERLNIYIRETWQKSAAHIAKQCHRTTSTYRCTTSNKGSNNRQVNCSITLRSSCRLSSRLTWLSTTVSGSRMSEMISAIDVRNMSLSECSWRYGDRRDLTRECEMLSSSNMSLINLSTVFLQQVAAQQTINTEHLQTLPQQAPR